MIMIREALITIILGIIVGWGLHDMFMVLSSHLAK